MNKDRSDVMHIAYTFNRLYIKPAAVSIFSMLSSRTSDMPIKIIILLEDNVKDEDLSIISKMVDEASACSMEIYRPKQFFNEIFNSDEHSSAAQEGVQVSFFRLYLSKLLKDTDRCLYMDSDLVVRRDLSNLYKTDLSNICFAGVVDRLCLEEKQLQRTRSYGVKDGMYINSGVTMMNLERLRDTGLNEKLLAYACEHAFPYLDQDTINFCCPEEIGLIPKVYNVFPDDMREEWDNAALSTISGQEVEDALCDPGIFHYIGPKKPWQYSVPRDIYWKQAEEKLNKWLKQNQNL